MYENFLHVTCSDLPSSSYYSFNLLKMAHFNKEGFTPRILRIYSDVPSIVR